MPRSRPGAFYISTRGSQCEGLTANRSKFALPDGKSEERSWKVGDATWTPAETHLPENLTDQPLELVLVELKHK